MTVDPNFNRLASSPLHADLRRPAAASQAAPGPARPLPALL
jgi:hypothetical protein